MRAFNRREFTLSAAAAAGVAAFPAVDLLAQDNPQPWQQALKKIVGDAKPIDGKVTIEIPEIAENGNTVPITISVNSPMTDVDHVKAIHIIATANPNAYVAGFRFTPLSGKASVSTRIRLASTQEVISVAELVDGKFLVGRRQVKVTIGGCGGNTP